ncbi:C-type mannose receptor 2-like [Leptopilina heterotoma]|uniref:C-type mannose receptor 2-like n=1 Tax=Leptopilina heterotoma TaxID=63436 RepID=UPI001CA956C8|nr:C-type mannose receptor 2-like [Leptopilina heterotoma]
MKNACENERQPVVEYFHVSNKQYLFFSERVTWEEARLLCLNYNAKLAILNDMEKATAIAQALAESDISSEDTWLGARRLNTIWTWIDSEEIDWRKNILSIESGIDNYPPWIREPTRPTKECLAIDRKTHSNPNFIDLDCRILKPFLCEKKPDDSLKSPVPAKWIQIQRSTFTLYHGKVTWDEAATFCRKQGARLAILQNLNVIEILTNSMTKTRPDFETVWIGAHFSYGQWIWMASGAILNSVSENGYPPWSSGRSQKKEGCLLLDRHLTGHTNFIEAKCNRKRDFVCEEYPQIEQDVWLNDPVKFSHENETYIIYSAEKSWQESYEFCKERGSSLAIIEDMNATNVIIEAMGDHPKGIDHIWTGGTFNLNTTKWEWIDNKEVIPFEKDKFGFPPWAEFESDIDFDNEVKICLNLDRSDHVKAHFYGLDCISRQPFICKITCNTPPKVKNGNWSCQSRESGNNCQMLCNSGFITKGLINATCSNNGGWTSSNNWLEFPECLNPSEYANEFVKSLGYEIQKVIGYYFIFDHWNEKIRQLSFKFAEQFLNIFPINQQLKMGMASNITNPSFQLDFHQTDNCLALETINNWKNKISANRTKVNKISSNWFKEVSKNTGRKSLIVAIIDRNEAKTYKKILQQLINAGHRVTVIGLREDEETLLPLATVGLDKKINLFLFDPEEFEIIIEEISKKRKTITSNCSYRLKKIETDLLNQNVSKLNKEIILANTTDTIQIATTNENLETKYEKSTQISTSIFEVSSELSQQNPSKFEDSKSNLENVPFNEAANPTKIPKNQFQHSPETELPIYMTNPTSEEETR